MDVFSAVSSSERSDVLLASRERYTALLAEGRLGEALEFYRARLAPALANDPPERRRLLAGLFAEGIDRPLTLRRSAERAWVLEAMAEATLAGGCPGEAVQLWRRALRIRCRQERPQSVVEVLCRLAVARSRTGELVAAERAAREALLMVRRYRFFEGKGLAPLADLWALRGRIEGASVTLKKARRLYLTDPARAAERTLALAQFHLRLGDVGSAGELAVWGRDLAQETDSASLQASAARLCGAVVLADGALDMAEDLLEDALRQAVAGKVGEEILRVRVERAELRRRHGEIDRAREELAQVWDGVKSGPYPLIDADALLVLGAIERDAGRFGPAVSAAARAFKRSWCDGAPFVYHWGVEGAARLLEDLGARVPEFEPAVLQDPLPEVEIEPHKSKNEPSGKGTT